MQRERLHGITILIKLHHGSINPIPPKEQLNGIIILIMSNHISLDMERLNGQREVLERHKERLMPEELGELLPLELHCLARWARNSLSGEVIGLLLVIMVPNSLNIKKAILFSMPSKQDNFLQMVRLQMVESVEYLMHRELLFQAE